MYLPPISYLLGLKHELPEPLEKLRTRFGSRTAPSSMQGWSSRYLKYRLTFKKKMWPQNFCKNKTIYVRSGKAPKKCKLYWSPNKPILNIRILYFSNEIILAKLIWTNLEILKFPWMGLYMELHSRFTTILCLIKVKIGWG